MAVESKPLFRPEVIDSFISRWENSGAAERANYQMFLAELCDLLEVPRPDPSSPDPENNLYVFDRAITRVNPDGSSVTNYIDLYKARHFVCETKQGSGESSGDHRSPHSAASGDGSSPPLLTAKEKQIHDQGLVTLLKQLHDELDEAVLEAYGWEDLAGTVLRNGPANELPMSSTKESLSDSSLENASSPHSHGPPGGRSLPEDELLSRLVALNHERAAEEKRGLIRWLRPDYQNRGGDHRSPQQTSLPGTDSDSSSSNQKSKILNPQSSINPSSPWPDRLPDQVTLIRQLLATDPTATAEQLSTRFGRKNSKRTEQIEGIIETLRGLGQV